MNDLNMLTIFLANTKTPHSIFSDKQFFDDEAIEDGAIICLSLRDSVHVYFDLNGRMVGSSKDSIGSYVKNKG